MRTHVVSVTDRHAKADDTELIQGTVGQDLVKLNLDEEWAGMDIEVTFVSKNGTVTPAVNDDGTYTVPYEAMELPGFVSVVVEGRMNGNVLKHAMAAEPFSSCRPMP